MENNCEKSSVVLNLTTSDLIVILHPVLQYVVTTATYVQK